MIHPGEGDTSTVRSVFIIDPNNKVRLTLTYPKSVGRNFDEIVRVIDALQVTDTNPISTPVDWKPGDRRHRRADALDRGREGEVRRRRRGQALPALDQAAQLTNKFLPDPPPRCVAGDPAFRWSPRTRTTAAITTSSRRRRLGQGPDSGAG